jgi:hypothetical protein
MSTESSTLVNLKDLFAMETERQTQEAVQAERKRAELEAKRAEAEREREMALGVAREQERARIEAEREARDAEMRERLSALRVELEQVRDQRAVLQTQMSDIAGRNLAPVQPKRGWLVSGLAGMSLATAMMATWMAWPKEVPMPQIETDTTPIVAEVEPVVVQPEVIATPEPVIATPEPVAVQPVRVRHPHVQHTNHNQQDLLHDLDTEGNEVLSDDFLNDARENVRCPRGQRCR